jgi:hypothetical protein
MRSLVLGLAMLAACAGTQTTTINVRDIAGHPLPTYTRLDSSFALHVTCSGVQYYVVADAVVGQVVRVYRVLPRGFSETGADEMCRRIARSPV